MLLTMAHSGEMQDGKTEAVRQYNKHMNAVDSSDQMVDINCYV